MSAILFILIIVVSWASGIQVAIGNVIGVLFLGNLVWDMLMAVRMIITHEQVEKS